MTVNISNCNNCVDNIPHANNSLDLYGESSGFEGDGIRNRRYLGLTLVETAMVLAVFAVMVAALVRFSSDSSESIRAKTTAERIMEVKTAASSYIRSNWTSLAGDAPEIPDALVILAGRQDGETPPPPGSLQELGFLPSSFIDLNGYGQRHALLIQLNSADEIEAIVTTYGGQRTPDAMLGTIAGIVGVSGGFVPNVAQEGEDGQIVGWSGGWRSVAANWGIEDTRPSPGHAVATLAFENQGFIEDFLYRNDIGIPDANRMNTRLDMNRNSIDNVKSIAGVPNLQISGTLELQSDLVANRDINVKNDVNIFGELVVGSDIVASQDLSIAETSRTKNLVVEDNATIDGTASLGLNKSVTTDIDTIAIDGTQNRNFNTDVKLAHLLPKMVAQYSYLATESEKLVEKPACAGGYSNARAIAVPITISQRLIPNIILDKHYEGNRLTDVTVNSNSYIDMTETVEIEHYSETAWEVKWSGRQVTGTERKAIVQAYCFYN